MSIPGEDGCCSNLVVASTSINAVDIDPKKPYKNSGKVKYMECLKNHAAAMGESATDGCREFMAGGVDGTLEALICSACNCHRNFHRKLHLLHPPQSPFSIDHRQYQCYHPSGVVMITKSSSNTISISSAAQTDDDQLDLAIAETSDPIAEGERGEMLSKKRYRTKFSQEQKEKMLSFAEKAGWTVQKVEENDVRSFCHEIGIKRKVLKVWMHNNKNQYAKKQQCDEPPATHFIVDNHA